MINSNIIVKKEKLFLFSDTHFGHNNILRFCPNRKFSNIEEHDESYIAKHNSMISPNDIVICLGDFSFRNIKSVSEYLNALNGKISIIFGNHDGSAIDSRNLFENSWGRLSHNEIVEFKWEGKKYVLSHYPLLSWNGRAHGRLSFFGHVHSCKERPFSCQLNSCDVGVDAWDHGPVAIEEAIKKAKDLNDKIKSHDVYDNNL
jgi:calcineurin-like phosphoesterase family protein